ncbi:MAG: shikimate kinase [Croceicoccus sp.]|nr:shikimate kinase [Croceicoccus sp.]MAL27138.1 shikimate kinase [Croceicoccus sp.]|tara:strand:- start:5654 stop:6349 length:696 start_codon:yes stop_codon:yes gene_type:complete
MSKPRNSPRDAHTPDSGAPDSGTPESGIPDPDTPDPADRDGAPALPDAAALADLTQRLDRPVVLVGLMGVGKSTVGRRLSQCLGTPFVDADDEVVKAAQMSIPEIFDRFGEDYFRDGERRVIARLIEDNAGRPAVIATGGGAFADDETRALILERAIAVWLDAELDTLVARVARKNTRPLLTGKDPRKVLGELMERRNPAYAQAPIRVTSDTGPQSNGVARIIAALGDYLA